MKPKFKIDVEVLLWRLRGTFTALRSGGAVRAYPFRLFTTRDLCEVAGIPLGAAPRLARALRAAGFFTVPSRGKHVRRLIDIRTGKKMKKCKVWFIPTGNTAKDAALLSDLPDVSHTRHHYNCERKSWKFTIRMTDTRQQKSLLAKMGLL